MKIDAVVTKVELYEDAYIDVDKNHIDETYNVFIKYKVEEKFTISYNHLNPKEITQPNSFILPIILFILGFASLVGGKGILTGNHWYNVMTTEEYTDLAFLTAFAIAKTEQVFYN